MKKEEKEKEERERMKEGEGRRRGGQGLKECGADQGKRYDHRNHKVAYGEAPDSMGSCKRRGQQGNSWEKSRLTCLQDGTDQDSGESLGQRAQKGIAT